MRSALLPPALLASAALVGACGSGGTTHSTRAPTATVAATVPTPTTGTTPAVSVGPERQSPARRARESAEWISPPRAVQQQGGRALLLFEKGRKVLIENGCLSCHRIGLLGKNGPGPSLSTIGATLPRATIRKALIHPRAPMPSFRNVGEARLRQLLAFLTDLRERSQYHRGAQPPASLGG